MDLTTRVCCACSTEKPLEEFRKDKSKLLGRDYRCKECYSGIQQKWRNKKRRIGLDLYTREEVDRIYESLLKKHGNVCPICQKSSKRRLALDHCHKTGQIRGVLCGDCNRALGFLEDDIERLKRAIDYLRQQDSMGDYVSG